MKDRMVNGKNWNEVLEALKAAKPKKKKKMKFEFIPVEEYIELLDKHVGVSNYTVEYTMPQYIQISSGQDLLSTKCRITVFDDEGGVVTYKEGLGASEFAYSAENGGRDVNVKNSPVYAQQSAFKTAAKALGCFDFYGTYGAVDSSEDAEFNGKSSKNAKASNASGQSTVLNVHTDGAFFEVGQRGDKPTYKLSVKVDGEQGVSELIFYPNAYGKISQKFNQLFTLVEQKSVFLKPSVRPCGERDGKKQYVFLSLN